MGEIELVNALRNVVADTVNSRLKPVSVQIAVYRGNNKVLLGNGLEIDTVVPTSVGTVEAGNKVLVIKEDGTNKYYVIARI